MERLRLDMKTARLWAQLNYLIPAGHDERSSVQVLPEEKQIWS